MSEATKSKRIEFRTTDGTRKLIERAALVQRTTLTEFAERCLEREARRVLADQTTLVLSPEAQQEWDALNERPAQTLADLQALMKRQSPFSS